MSDVALVEQSDSTSHTLLQRVRRQDPAAWERFTNLYGPLVYRWCVTNGLRAQDASDILQEVFQAVFQGIGRFQREAAGQAFRGWLWTITRNKICDHFRRAANEPRAAGGVAGQELLDRLADLPTNDPEPVESYRADLAHRALELIQTEFEATTWQAFLAMTVDGLSAADAAARLEITQAAAYKAKSRVLHRLRRELEGLLE